MPVALRWVPLLHRVPRRGEPHERNARPSLSPACHGRYATGHNIHGQLGLGNKESVQEPSLVGLPTSQTFASSRGLVNDVVNVACGVAHSAAITGTDACARCRRRVLRAVLCLVLHAGGLTPLAAGRGHVPHAADGRAFTWGHGGHGQLGHGNCESYASPKQVEAIRPASFVVHVTGGDDERTLVRPGGKPNVSAPPQAQADGIGADATAPMGSFGQVLARRKSTKAVFYGVSMVACGERHTVFLRVRRRAPVLAPCRAAACECACDVYVGDSPLSACLWRQADGLAVLSCGDNEVGANAALLRGFG